LVFAFGVKAAQGGMNVGAGIGDDLSYNRGENAGLKAAATKGKT